MQQDSRGRRSWPAMNSMSRSSTISSIKAHKINVWGVGTNLVTGKDQPALDGVYKLSALKNEKGKWRNKGQVSEQLVKMTDPGIFQVRRYFDGAGNIADMVYEYPLQNCHRDAIL